MKKQFIRLKDPAKLKKSINIKRQKTKQIRQFYKTNNENKEIKYNKNLYVTPLFRLKSKNVSIFRIKNNLLGMKRVAKVYGVFK